MLIFWSAFEAKSSIILSYCCLDSWTELRSSIIALATVEKTQLAQKHASFALLMQSEKLIQKKRFDFGVHIAPEQL